ASTSPLVGRNSAKSTWSWLNVPMPDAARLVGDLNVEGASLGEHLAAQPSYWCISGDLLWHTCATAQRFGCTAVNIVATWAQREKICYLFDSRLFSTGAC